MHNNHTENICFTAFDLQHSDFMADCKVPERSVERNK